MDSFRRAAEALCSDRITFAEFAEQTATDRRRFVARLYRKLQPVPVWYSVEDAEQDFLLVLFKKSRTYDPTKACASGYLLFGLKDVTKVVQKARGVEQHRRKGPAMFERTFAALGVDELRGGTCESTPETSATRAEQYAILKRLCSSREQRAVIGAMEASGGTMPTTIAALQQRRGGRYADAKRAERAVRRTVEELTMFYGTEMEAHQ